MKYLFVLFLTGCATTTTPITFTEEPGGTCGELDPVATIDEVCRDLGGVADRYTVESALELRCNEGLLTWARFDTHTGEGVFEITTNDCESQYWLSR